MEKRVLQLLWHTNVRPWFIFTIIKSYFIRWLRKCERRNEIKENDERKIWARITASFKCMKIEVRTISYLKWKCVIYVIRIWRRRKHGSQLTKSKTCERVFQVKNTPINMFEKRAVMCGNIRSHLHIASKNWASQLYVFHLYIKRMESNGKKKL